MQPIEDLLHRITRDAGFGKGSFTIGHHDRVAGREQLVALESTAMDQERPRTLTVSDERGAVVHLPLHRVRTVYRNGVVIWQRPSRAP